MRILADLHTHTAASMDGRQTLAQLVAAAKAKGLHAVAVTDHDRYCPLSEFVDGVLLIPGCEFATTAGHMTGLFLEREPKTERMTAQETIEEIHRCGGVAVLAHPFKHPGCREEELDFIPDGVETANARAGQKVKDANRKAAFFAARIGAASIGGSDAHSAGEVANAYTELECEALTREALKQAILRRECRAVLQRNTPHRISGLSQWARRRRQGGVKNMVIGLVYLGWCVVKDIKEKCCVRDDKGHRSGEKDQAPL